MWPAYAAPRATAGVISLQRCSAGRSAWPPRPYFGGSEECTIAASSVCVGEVLRFGGRFGEGRRGSNQGCIADVVLRIAGRLRDDAAAAYGAHYLAPIERKSWRMRDGLTEGVFDSSERVCREQKSKYRAERTTEGKTSASRTICNYDNMLAARSQGPTVWNSARASRKQR
jgi:hypothetical protein